MTIWAAVSFWLVRFSTFTSHPSTSGWTVALTGTGADCHQSLTKSWLVHTGTKISALKLSPFCTTVIFSLDWPPSQLPANSPRKVANYWGHASRNLWLDGV